MGENVQGNSKDICTTLDELDSLIKEGEYTNGIAPKNPMAWKIDFIRYSIDKELEAGIAQANASSTREVLLHRGVIRAHQISRTKVLAATNPMHAVMMLKKLLVLARQNALDYIGEEDMHQHFTRYRDTLGLLSDMIQDLSGIKLGEG